MKPIVEIGGPSEGRPLESGALEFGALEFGVVDVVDMAFSFPEIALFSPRGARMSKHLAATVTGRHSDWPQDTDGHPKFDICR